MTPARTFRNHPLRRPALAALALVLAVSACSDGTGAGDATPTSPNVDVPAVVTITINSQPTEQSVVRGGMAVFNVAASASTGALSVQWQVQSTALQAPQVRAVAQNHLAWIWCCLGQGARALQLLRSDDDDVLDTLVRLRRWTLRGELQRLCGTAPPGPPPADWTDCKDPATRAQAELALARALPPQDGAARLAVLAEQLLVQGQATHALHARVLRVGALAQRPADQALAAAEAQAVAADMAGTTPLAAYLPEVWSVLADACRRGGEAEAAARFDAQALGWVQRASSDHVPAAFRAGFEQRNRVNAVLLRALPGRA